MKELSAMDKMMAVKLIMETLGYEFEEMTVSEAFNMFRSINEEIQAEMRRNTLNRDYNMNPGSIEI
jgi:hypothetical protein